MMNRLIRALLIIVCFGIVSCSGSGKKDREAQLSVFNASQQEMTAEFRAEKGQDSEEISLSPFENSGYKKLSPNTYNFTILSKEKALLEKKIGLATKEKYTAILYGKPELLHELNQSTFGHKMHYIFQGSENYTKNGYLPGLMVFRDKVKLRKGNSQVRAFHAAAGISPITIKLRKPEKQKGKSLIKGLDYPKPMMGKKIKSGDKIVELYLKGSPEPLIEKAFDFESKKVYTIVVYKDQQKLDVQILEAK